MMDIDTNAIEDSMTQIENAHSLIESALSLVNSAKSNLDPKINGSISGFNSLENILDTSKIDTSKIIEKCSNFIADVLKMVLLFKGFDTYLGKIIDVKNRIHIKNEDYPSLSTSAITYLENYLSDGEYWRVYDMIRDSKDINEKKDLVRLLFSYNPNLYGIGYEFISDVLHSFNSDEEKNEFFKVLDGKSIFYYIGYNSIEIPISKIHELCDCDLLNDIQLIIYGLEHNQFFDVNNEPITINISGVDVTCDLEILSGAIYNGKFDYVFFLMTAYELGNIPFDSCDKTISFNHNGIDITTSINEIVDFFKKDDGTIDYWQFTNYFLRNNDLFFIKYLYENGKINNNEKQNIIIKGQNITCSMEDFVSCFQYDEEEDYRYFDYGILLSKVELSESKIIYFNSLMYNPISLTDITVVNSGEAMQFFNEYGSVNQGGLDRLMNSPMSDFNSYKEFERLMQFACDKYGLSEEDAYIIMSSLDLVGACSYADMCNIIYELYDFDTEAFEKDFGYPMINKDGSLNGNQLLLDLYIYQNIGLEIDDATTLIIQDEEGNLRLNGDYLIQDDTRRMMDVHGQRYMSYVGGFESNYMCQFLSSNSCSVDGYDTYSAQSILIEDENSYEILLSAIDNGQMISMSLSMDYDMYRVGDSPSPCYNMSGGHAVTPVGLTEEGVLVRSWGDLYYVPYSDIYSFTIIENNIVNGRGQ